MLGDSASPDKDGYQVEWLVEPGQFRARFRFQPSDHTEGPETLQALPRGCLGNIRWVCERLVLLAWRLVRPSFTLCICLLCCLLLPTCVLACCAPHTHAATAHHPRMHAATAPLSPSAPIPAAGLHHYFRVLHSGSRSNRGLLGACTVRVHVGDRAGEP
jgi:hypothetical protein